MAMLVNKFVGTAGTNVTAANSGPGGDALAFPTTGTSAVVYSSAVTNPFTGGTVAKVEAAAGTIGEVRWNPANSDQGASRMVFWATGLPTTASNDDMTIRGTRQNAGVRYHTGGQRRTLNIGSEIGGGGNYSGVTGEWVVQDLVNVQGTTASNGTIKSRLRRLSDMSTIVGSYVATNRDAGVIGTDVINSFRYGKTTSAAVLPAFYIAEIAADPAAVDWLPDPGGNVVPLSGLVADLTTDVEPGTTVTLTLSDSDADGTVITRTLTQTAGPTVTLSGSGGTRTFEAPYTLAGTTLTFQYVVIDDDGASSDPATESITVLRATERTVTVGGASPTEVPARITVV